MVKFNATEFSGSPASYAFSIWTLIYINLILSTFNYKWKNSALQWLLISSCLNLLWLYVWGKRNTRVSLIVISLLTVSVWFLLSKTYDINRYIHQGLGVYAAWVLAATVINFSIYLREKGNYKDTTLAKMNTIILGTTSLYSASTT